MCYFYLFCNINIPIGHHQELQLVSAIAVAEVSAIAIAVADKENLVVLFGIHQFDRRRRRSLFDLNELDNGCHV